MKRDARGFRIDPAFPLPAGFELWEQDDHLVDLYHDKNHVAVFPAHAATERAILSACREYKNGGKDACEQ